MKAALIAVETQSPVTSNKQIRGEMNMYPKTNRPLRHFLPAIAIFGAVIGWSSPSDAYVQKIVIDQKATVNFTPIIMGPSTPGPSTSYTIYSGRILVNWIQTIRNTPS